jgi:hypothetical protein
MADEFNMEQVSNDLGESLFGPSEPVETPAIVETPDLDTGVTDVADPQVPEGEPEATDPETPTDEVPTPVGAPKTWRKEALAVWETLPEVVKAEVAKREEDMFKGIEQYKQGAQIGDNFQKCLAPHMDHLQRAGVNPYEEINGLLEYGKIMRFGTAGERMSLLSSIAQEYGIDLLDLAEHAPAAPYIDPTVQALQKEVEQLKSGRQQETTQREQAIRSQVQAQVDAFKAKPEHEHFDLLEPEMTLYMKSGVCKTLEEAYEKAIWANPVTRAKETERQATLLKTQSQARVKAAQAASAANLKTNARPGSATAPTGSMDDTLAATMQDIRSRT